MIDISGEFGARVARHLREETVVWLTSVTPSGRPIPRPVWFLWDEDESVRVYSMPGARVRNVEANPNVSLNFGGDGAGGDVVVISGRAAIEPAAPSAAENLKYLSKYDGHIARIGHSPASFAQRYSVPLRVAFTRVDGH